MLAFLLNQLGIIMRKLAYLTGLLAMSSAMPANAALIATLGWVQQTGVALSNESIPVYLRLTLDPASDAITTDSSGNITGGFDVNTFPNPNAPDPSPIDLNDPNSHTFYNEGAGCGGSLDGCGAGAYSFEFNFNQPNFISPADFSLQPGDSFEWLLGTFVPKGGNAAAGLYSFNFAIISANYFSSGLDPNSDVDDVSSSVFIVNTCPDFNADCAFTRRVLAAPTPAVPEPSTWMMMIAGFGAVGASVRRRRAVVTFA